MPPSIPKGPPARATVIAAPPAQPETPMATTKISPGTPSATILVTSLSNDSFLLTPNLVHLHVMQ